MPSSANSPGRDASRSGVLRLLNEQLESAERLCAEMRQGLLDSDAEAIDGATARLRTLALECKLLHDEFRRFPAVSTEACTDQDDPQFLQARDAFERTATRLARSAAVSGGILSRLVELSRHLIDSLGNAGGETYLASGRKRERAVGGLGLRGMA